MNRDGCAVCTMPSLYRRQGEVGTRAGAGSADWLVGSGSVRGTDQDRFVDTTIGWSVPRTRLQEEVGTRTRAGSADSGQERISWRPPVVTGSSGVGL